MNKGERSHAKELYLWEERPDGVAGEEVRKGRNAELIAARNEHILYRHYYYKKYEPHTNWAYVRGQLSEQFYLSEATVAEIVFDTVYETRRREIWNEGLSVAELKKKFKYF